MVVLALEVDLHLPASSSLKDKRMVVRSLLDTARRRFGVAAAEVDHQEQRQRALLAFATVSSSVSHATAVMDNVDRLVWSMAGVDVLSSERRWLE
jgi:uncharacterized protein YlxP (DUF503 family)